MTQNAEWTEEASDDFIALGEYFVPDRKMQTDVVTSMMAPHNPAARFEVLDLCCGQGYLSEAILRTFPGATVVGLDGSRTMLRQAVQDLKPYGDRFRTELFDIGQSAWRRRENPPLAIVSSLAVHHLDGHQKRTLYRDLHDLLAPGGRMVIADIIDPVGPLGHELGRRMWDEAVRERSLRLAGDLSAYESFHEMKWSNFEYPDPMDQPSPLPDQLDWLRDIGFVEVDVYWMRAGHAIFGGAKPAVAG